MMQAGWRKVQEYGEKPLRQSYHDKGEREGKSPCHGCASVLANSATTP